MDRGDYTGSVTFLGGIAALVASFWLDLSPLIKAWFWLAGIDMAAGILVAWNTSSLNVEAAWVGTRRKAMMLLLIGAGAVLDLYASPEALQLPVSLAAGVAGSFAVKEFLSILRHSTNMGLSIPEPFASVAAKFSVKAEPSPPPGPPLQTQKEPR